jgi:hypothetical protein
MHVSPEAPKFRLTSTVEGLQAVVPPKRSWFAIPFLTLWLCGWAFGEFRAIGELLNPSEKTPVEFLALWLTGWTLGGIFALGTILWQVAGRELITVSSSFLVHRVEALGFGRTRIYSAENIKALRATDYASGGFQNQQGMFPPFFGPGIGPVAFDYGAKTIRLAPGIDEAEAKVLVRELARGMPSAVSEI